jgi:hypothetical protein
MQCGLEDLFRGPRLVVAVSTLGPCGGLGTIRTTTRRQGPTLGAPAAARTARLRCGDRRVDVYSPLTGCRKMEQQSRISKRHARESLAPLRNARLPDRDFGLRSHDVDPPTHFATAR